MLVALFGPLLPVDEYRAQGMSGSVDGGGPLIVLLFAAPSLMIYAGGVVYHAWLPKHRRRLVLPAMLVLCGVMVTAAGTKAATVY